MRCLYGYSLYQNLGSVTQVPAGPTRDMNHKCEAPGSLWEGSREFQASGLHAQFQASLCYIARSCIGTNKNPTKQKTKTKKWARTVSHGSGKGRWSEATSPVWASTQCPTSATAEQAKADTHILACAQQLKPELHSLPGQGLQAVPPACKEYTPCLSPLLSEHFGWAWFVSLEVWVRQP